MSSLRNLTKKNADGPEGDIEAPIDEGSSAKVCASASRAKHNPFFLVKAVFRKVFDILTADGEDLTLTGRFVSLLKDTLAGIILGITAIFLVIFLDHRNIVHFQSAHHFREAAFQSLKNPETIANVEESSGLKFMAMDEYEYKKKEIEDSAVRITSLTEKLKKQNQEAEEKQKEVELVKVEYDSLVGNPLVGLDKYCGSCTWAPGKTCDARVQFMINTYNMGPIAAKVHAMGVPSCMGVKIR